MPQPGDGSAGFPVTVLTAPATTIDITRPDGVKPPPETRNCRQIQCPVTACHAPSGGTGVAGYKKAKIKRQLRSGSGLDMTTRATVAMGVWVLLMVLIGTMTVGIASSFYLGMVGVLAVVVAALMIVSRYRGQRPRN